jgi:hypothetical protein
MTKALLAVLDGSAPPAVLPWSVPELPAAKAQEAARAAGWRTDLLDLAGVRDKPGFMDRCAVALRLPDYFGRNWDALDECLGDPSWWPEQDAAGWLVLVRGWQEYAAEHPHDWVIAEQILADAVSDGARVAVLLEEAAGVGQQ